MLAARQTVLDYGSDPNQLSTGKIDASSAIDAALLAGNAYLPCGTYRLDHALQGGQTRPFVLEGEATGCVTLNVAVSTGDFIRLEGARRPLIAKLTIYAQSSGGDGAVIHLLGTNGATLDQIAIVGAKAGDGIWVDGANTTQSIDLTVGHRSAFLRSWAGPASMGRVVSSICS